MGFVLSILYFATYYLTPITVFGPLAAAHIELIFAAVVLFVSVPALTKSFVLRTAQSSALAGLALGVFLSVLIGMRWPGGALNAFLEFIPNAFAYLLVCLHCNTKKKLQFLVLMLLFVCLFVIAHGCIDLIHGVPQGSSPRSGTTESAGVNLWNIQHPYLLAMQSDAGEWFYRLRGLGEISDPNDFGQLVVCLLPLMFIFWRAQKMIRNIFCVILPVCVMFFGVYLTHSRGALVALMAVAIMAMRRRIGTLPALLVAGGLFVAASALNFTGGREISAESGSGRVGLWGTGLELLKAHPFFGVGFGNFADSAGLTAHNSIVVCAGELGMFGLYFWTLFLFPTVRDALAIASPAKVNEGEPIIAEEGLFPQSIRKIETIDKVEINHLGRLVVLSLTGFLVAGFFLSRAYVLTLFLLGGMAEVVYEIGLRRGMIAPRLPLARVLLYAVGLTILLVVFMYIMVRVLNLMH